MRVLSLLVKPAIALTLSFLTLSAYSQQVPDGIIFQAVAKDPSGVPAKDRTIYIKDMIVQGSAGGTTAYSESFVVQASADGVFTITIGKGTRISGANGLLDINWGNGPYFLNIKVAIAPSIPTPEWKAEEQYVDMGTSQFFSQPFAFMAAKVAGFELLMKAADTTAMLAPYLRKSDTLSLSDRIDSKISIKDTASLFNFFMRKLDTSAMLRGYALKGDTAGLGALVQTIIQHQYSTGIITGPSSGNGGADKLSITDTAAMLSGYARIGNILNYLDTAAMLSGYERAGLTIKYSDSSAMLSNLLRLSDTATMLNAYVLKSELASLLPASGQGIDSASLALYYKRADALAALALKENSSNKSANPLLGNSNVLFPTQKAVKTYVDSVVAAASMGAGPASVTKHYVDSVVATVSSGGGVSKTYVDSLIAASATPDATTTVKGKITLGGDLAGTADAPLVGDGKITTNKLADSSVTFSKLQVIGREKLLGNPNSTTGAVTEITLGPGLSFTGNTLNVAAGGGGTLDTFTSNIIVYSSNGLGKYSQGQTIPAKGKTASQVLIDALTQAIPPTYTQPTVSISSSPSGGTMEIGTPLSISLSSTFNQNDAGSSTATVYNKNGSALGGNTDNIASLTASVSYTATVSYGQGPVKNNNLGDPDPTGRINAGSRTSGAVTFTPQAKRYWGYCAGAMPTDAEIKAALGGGSELSGAKAKGAFDISISSGTHYVFYAYPASLGGLSSLSVGGFGSLPAFDLTTRSFSNAQGYAQSYNIYVGKNTFSATVSNIITN